MVPAAYVRLEALPLTDNGKLDRAALPAPGSNAFSTRDFEPPRGKTEERLARIWADLLRTERVGRHDSFFALGGHSLLAVRMLSRLRQDLGADMPLADLFARPVLADFAAAVSKGARRPLPPIEPASRDGALPLSFAQQRLWFVAQIEGASQGYLIPLNMRLRGELDKRALKLALNRLVARHEALRTVFFVGDGEPVQRIAAAGVGFALEEYDIEDERDREGALERLAIEESHTPFDLEAGPLARARLIRLNDRDHALLVTLHHIVFDGWSTGVFQSRVERALRGLPGGRRRSPAEVGDPIWGLRGLAAALALRRNAEGAGRLLAARTGGRAGGSGLADGPPPSGAARLRRLDCAAGV
jgi:hypothetical protein